MTEPGNGTRERLKALEDDVKELRAMRLDVVSDRTRRLEEDIRDFRAQVRGEMGDLKKLVVSETSSLRRAFYTFILGTLTAVVAFAVAQALIP